MEEKKLQSVILNFDNGDRETIKVDKENGVVIFNKGKERFSKIIIGCMSRMDLLEMLLGTVSMCAEHDVIPTKLLEDFNDYLSKNTKEIIKAFVDEEE